VIKKLLSYSQKWIKFNLNALFEHIVPSVLFFYTALTKPSALL
jgi:hypothetical protein